MLCAKYLDSIRKRMINPVQASQSLHETELREGENSPPLFIFVYLLLRRIFEYLYVL